MGIETEIKFSATGMEMLDELAALKEVAGYQVVDMGVKLQTDTCFDTDDQRFFREKIVFRLRVRDNGSVLTFKAQLKDGSVSADNLYHRIEVEQPTHATVDDISAGELPDIPPTHALRDAVGELSILPSLIIANNRRIMLLMKDDEPRFEMVLDDVMFRGPGGKAQVYEVEVETIAGGEDELREVGAWLKENYGLEAAGPSKYILGMEMVGGV